MDHGDKMATRAELEKALSELQEDGLVQAFEVTKLGPGDSVDFLVTLANNDDDNQVIIWIAGQQEPSLLLFRQYRFEEVADQELESLLSSLARQNFSISSNRRHISVQISPGMSIEAGS
jgi:hypothetical protein